MARVRKPGGGPPGTSPMGLLGVGLNAVLPDDWEIGWNMQGLQINDPKKQAVLDMIKQIVQGSL